MRDTVLCIIASLGFLVSHIFSPQIAHTAIITVVNLDGAGEGFNDPSAPDSASASGGNSGATLGAQRAIAFERAADIWANRLSSTVEIRVDANFNPLTCTATSAVLGLAGPNSVHGNFTGAPLANTWYPQALANSRAVTDLIPGTSDIGAQFNSAIGTTCAFPRVWYYGLDSNPPAGTLDFVSVVLHELGHGLGFASFVTLSSGAKLSGFDDVYSLNLEDHSTGKLYSQMTDAERVTASQNTGNLHWVGPNVVAASGSLTAGVHPTGHVQMYAPSPQQPISSVSHFDTAVTPDELMEPVLTGANHDIGLTLVLFSDLGWAITAPGHTDADFDGDGKTDVAVYQTSSGNWFGVLSTNGFSQVLNFGGPNYLPVPGDYDGDGLSEAAVYETTTGNWFVDGSSAGFFSPALNFGGAGFIPVPGDYDGDGNTDVAVYQQSTGNWFVVGTTSGFFNPALNFGGAGFIPVPGDYDGDGRTDAAVYQSSTGNWFGVGTTSGFFQVLSFGGSGYTPVAGDYDGDGKTDAAVYQSSTGNWFVVGSTAGFFSPALNFGGSGFVPVLPQVTILRAMGLL